MSEVRESVNRALDLTTGICSLLVIVSLIVQIWVDGSLGWKMAATFLLLAVASGILSWAGDEK